MLREGRAVCSRRRRRLVLDQCLYLAEHGYAVDLRAFCAPRVSPRNLLIVGTLN